MTLSNGILTIGVDAHGAELKSVIKKGREYLWCADADFWGRTSPVLFPFVGGLNEKQYRHKGKRYPMGQHGFARDCDFVLTKQTEDSLCYTLRADEDTLARYPFAFQLDITYTLCGSSVKVYWNVVNEGEDTMYFSIGAHPAFYLAEDATYFRFDTDKDMVYHLIDQATGLYDAKNRYVLKNDGYILMKHEMFDQDALIFEGNQAQAVSLCDGQKNPYVTVRFSAPLFGIWTPVKKKAPFVCIEPWYGRCDRKGFCGELADKDEICALDAGKTFTADYEMEFL